MTASEFEQEVRTGLVDCPRFVSISLTQVANGRWLILLDGFVLDVTSFAAEHPGGAKLLFALKVGAGSECLVDSVAFRFCCSGQRCDQGVPRWHEHAHRVGAAPVGHVSRRETAANPAAAAAAAREQAACVAFGFVILHGVVEWFLTGQCCVGK